MASTISLKSRLWIAAGNAGRNHELECTGAVVADNISDIVS